MAEDGKPRSPLDDARDAIRKAREAIAPGIKAASDAFEPAARAAKGVASGVGPGIKAASVILEPAARAAAGVAKEVAWEARRAVRPEKLHDQMNKALGLDPAHEVAVDGAVYRIDKVADLRFEARDARTEVLQGAFVCDAMGNVRALEGERAEIRKLLAIAEEAVKAGLAP